MISSIEIDMDIMRSCCSKVEECRICHDQDIELNMETPCSCRGTLKYAHRKCVQRWCDEKGDIICEICLTQFEPDYKAPIPLFHYGGIPMNLREFTRRDLLNPRYISMVSSDNDYMDTDFNDYSTISAQSLACYRIVAIIFTILMVLRLTLPVLIFGGGNYSMKHFTLLMLIAIGVLFPICIMVKSFIFIQRRRHLQASSSWLASSDEESEIPHPHSQFVHIR